jgi:cystathionine gamma-lyase
MRFATRAIHAGQPPDPATGAVNVPIYLSSTYSIRDSKGRYVYSRTHNPTREALEANLAALEGGKHGLAFSSGMGAITTLMSLFRRGDHIVASDDLYGGTYRIFTRIFSDFGLEFSFVDMTSLQKVRKALRPSTRALWAESPTNPLMKVVDLSALATLSHEVGGFLVVDNTFASPYLQEPLALGADVVMHSTTKYLSGHSDVIGGAAITSNEALHERLRFSQNALGAVPSPLDCFLVLRGTKTLALRMERHSANALEVARFLREHRGIARVHYPGLPDHPQHKLARRQMRAYGGMLSFELSETSRVKAFLDALKLIIVGESLGGVESLIEHPASMTHASVPAAEREKVGIDEGLIRLSVGCEDVEDLLEDLDQALG